MLRTRLRNMATASVTWGCMARVSEVNLGRRRVEIESFERVLEVPADL